MHVFRMNIYSVTMSCMALEWTFSVNNSWEVYIVMQLHNTSDTSWATYQGKALSTQLDLRIQFYLFPDMTGMTLEWRQFSWLDINDFRMVYTLPGMTCDFTIMVSSLT